MKLSTKEYLRLPSLHLSEIEKNQVPLILSKQCTRSTKSALYHLQHKHSCSWNFQSFERRPLPKWMLWLHGDQFIDFTLSNVKIGCIIRRWW